ncbi:MAG: type II secretion system protein [Anaerolineae bacterium]|nr:type II secretion system protein [Gloeobacterales cyanobacterium ES-bin-313]
MAWDFRRSPTGFTLPELLVSTVIAATLTGAMVSAITYWNQTKSKSVNGAQIPLIESALRQYLRTYGNLPNLSASEGAQLNEGEESEEIAQWLRIYPSASGQPMPQGITYSLQRQYVPSTLSKGQVPGEVRLAGTGCSPIDPATSCTLSLTP